MFSPVKKYEEDHEYMDGVVREDGDSILLPGIHCVASRFTKIILSQKHV